MARNGRKGRGRWLLLVVLVVVLGGAVFALRAALKPDNSIDSSKIAAVERGDIARSVVATGKIEPRSKVEIKSKASGIVKKIYVDYGDRVREGQVLAELDKEELEERGRVFCAVST